MNHPYRRLELALLCMKSSGITRFNSREISKLADMLPQSAGKIMSFTRGVEYHPSTKSYTFRENESIVVED